MSYLGIAGEAAFKSNTAQVGIAGVIPANLSRSMVGVAGLDTAGRKALAGVTPDPVAHVGVAGMNTASLAEVLPNLDGRAAVTSERLGDRAARQGWSRGVFFAAFSYLVMRQGSEIVWRKSLRARLARECRALPLYLDSDGYRRELTGTAPRWSHAIATYEAAIALLAPDGYAAFDYPQDRARSLAALARLEQTFPADVTNGRLWPVFSIRWAFNPLATVRLGQLPRFAGQPLAGYIPLNRTQVHPPAARLEEIGRCAVAQALALAADPDFRRMVDRYGQVMIGGLVQGPIPRLGRHLFASTLQQIFPDLRLWLLGQANYAVVNGLGRMGLLDQVWTDGSWWIHDARCERLAFVQEGLITMLTVGGSRRKKDPRAGGESLFTLHELMSAGLRSLLAAYAGLITWPPPEPLVVDLADVEAMSEVKRRVQVAQLTLNFPPMENTA